MIPLVVLLSSTLGSLLELARIPVLSRRQRDDAVSLMKELRREGFTNRDLAVLVGNRWKEPTIKKFTRGVKVRSTAERDVVLETFSRFTSAGKTLQDVEDYLAVNNQLDSQQLSFETRARARDGFEMCARNYMRFGQRYPNIFGFKQYLLVFGLKQYNLLWNEFNLHLPISILLLLESDQLLITGLWWRDPFI